MVVGARGDTGQTLPLYVMAIAGLLFVGFAFFAFAQAATVRNGAQSAADAAALAAAYEGRDALFDGFLDALDHDEDGGEWLGGEGWRSPAACDQAGVLAARNRADVLSCAEASGARGYTVKVRTRYTVGESVVPGTENKRASALATAVIEPRCALDEDAGGKSVAFSCAGRHWSIDPDDDASSLKPFDLFSVYLDE